MTITFSSLDLLSGIGRFESWRPSADLPKMRRYCLYYGFNGTGKSSVARALGELAKPLHERKRPESCRVRVTLSDGATLEDSDDATVLRNRIFVFSSDFVDENFRWKDGFATPVFYIGKAQSDIALRLNTLRERLPSVVERQTKARSQWAKADKLLTEFKRDRARQIESDLGINRGYRSPNLEADYAGFDPNNFEEMKPGDAAGLRAFMASAGQFGPLTIRSSMLEDIPGVRYHALSQLLRTVPASNTLATLKPYPEMQGWAIEGAKYHLENSLDWCLHCGSGLGSASRERLASFHDDTIVRLRDEIGMAIVAIDRSRNGIRADTDALPAVEKIVPSLRDKAQEALGKIYAAATELNRQLTQQMDHLSEKLKTLDKTFSRLPGFDETYEGAFVTYRESFDRYAYILEAHNSAVLNLGTEISSIQDKLKKEILFAGHPQYVTLVDDVYKSKETSEKSDTEVAALTSDISDLEAQLRDHRAAAELISHSITRYLGHGELTIEAEDEGFRICRDGRPVSGPLSEGERTAIAFCYFLTLVEAEGRRLGETIVILDDPISSLDSGALNYTASLIGAKLEGAAQVIVLTHNIHFMHEIKKWIRRVEGAKVFKDHLASLYFVENFIPADRSSRNARIVRMSKLLHAYESEYHFMFDLILKCAREPVEDETFTYLLPNALRKLLDTFLAFKEPKSESVESRTLRLSREFEALDETRLGAVLRMLQTESHADAITDGSTFSPIPIEETRAACRAVLCFIRTIDQRHFDVMCDVCDCHNGSELAA